MNGEDSFDPRTWGQSPSSKTDLPEAWAAVAQDKSPESDEIPSKASPSDKTSRTVSGGLRPYLPYMSSLALLGLTAGLAWTMRSAAPVEATTAAAGDVAAEALAPDENISSRTLVLASAADIAGALATAGLPPAEVAAAAKAAVEALGQGGEVRAVLILKKTPDGTHLLRLEASNPDGSGAVISRTPNGQIASSRVEAELSRTIAVVRGELDSESFYSSAVAAGVTDILIPDFINAFSFDFNLASEIHPGDTFEVAYEQTVNARGEPLGQPQLLFASLTTPEKRRALYRFTPKGQEVGWFDGNGASTVRSFMRTPVDGARISSKFGYRFHPVLHYNKLHKGTDFAAPIGTPIYAASDATVQFAAMKGANGNLTVLQHDNGWRTLYLHQNRFMPGIVAGARVRQGQHIGDIGTTGRSTGPHLHYEVHIDGAPVDPLSIRTEAGRKGLEGADLAAFLKQRDRVDVARSRQAF